MADVVSKLKLTPKGLLKYSNWNPVELLDNEKQSLHISPFSIKMQSTLIKQEGDSLVNSPNYEVYFSPERKNSGKSRKKNQHDLNSKTSTLAIADQTDKIASKTDDRLLINTKTQTAEVNTTLENLVNSPVETNALNSYDSDIGLALKKLKSMRLQKFQTHINDINNEYKEEMIRIDELQKEKHYYQVQQIEAEQKKHSKEIEIYRDFAKQKNDNTEEKLKQADLHRKDIEARVQKRDEEKRLQQEKVKTLGELLQPANKAVENVKYLYQKCKASGHEIPQHFILVMSEVSKESTECSAIISKGISSPSTHIDSYIQTARSKVEILQNLVEKCKQFANELDKKKEQEEKENVRLAVEKAKVEAAAKAVEAAKQTAAAATTPTSTVQQPTVVTTQTQNQIASAEQLPALSANISIASVVPALAPLEATLRPILTMCVPKLAFQEYLHLQRNLQECIKQHQPVSKSTDKSIKTFKFDIYKVINTTINAVSDESPKHLLNKIMKINTLLTGQDIEMGGKKITIKDSKYGLALSKELLAKKIVLQGAQQVAASFKTVFPIAAFATGIWALFPDVGELILAHFHINCPFLVPFYIPKSKDMATTDYCKLVGYDVDGNEIEAEDKYLKKLSGLVRLYFAILQTELPPQLGTRNHPHGLEFGWLWFTRLLNLEPRPSVTATIIYDFLEVAGYAMLQRYGKQFRKLLLLLCDSYLPKILAIAPNDSKAAEIRLKMFLDECIKTGNVKEHDGRITAKWWNTGRY